MKRILALATLCVTTGTGAVPAPPGAPHASAVGFRLPRGTPGAPFHDAAP